MRGIITTGKRPEWEGLGAGEAPKRFGGNNSRQGEMNGLPHDELCDWVYLSVNQHVVFTSPRAGQ